MVSWLARPTATLVGLPASARRAIHPGDGRVPRRRAETTAALVDDVFVRRVVRGVTPQLRPLTTSRSELRARADAATRMRSRRPHCGVAARCRSRPPQRCARSGPAAPGLPTRPAVVLVDPVCERRARPSCRGTSSYSAGSRATSPCGRQSDLARLVWRFDALAALDQFLRVGVLATAELTGDLDRFRGYRGIVQARHLVRWPIRARSRSRSPSCACIGSRRGCRAGSPGLGSRRVLVLPSIDWICAAGGPLCGGVRRCRVPFHGRTRERDVRRRTWLDRQAGWEIEVFAKDDVTGRTPTRRHGCAPACSRARARLGDGRRTCDGAARSGRSAVWERPQVQVSGIPATKSGRSETGGGVAVEEPDGLVLPPTKAEGRDLVHVGRIGRGQGPRRRPRPWRRR